MNLLRMPKNCPADFGHAIVLGNMSGKKRILLIPYRLEKKKRKKKERKKYDHVSPT